MVRKFPATTATYVVSLQRKLSKALDRFESSYHRLPPMKSTVESYTDEELGSYDEFMSRFARLTDIFLSQYIRARLQIEDPAFRGSLLDSLNLAEKLGMIDSAKAWYEIRELRNRQAHEYEEEELIKLFKQTIDEVPRISSVRSMLNYAPR
jgi:hypothetical protein